MHLFLESGYAVTTVTVGTNKCIKAFILSKLLQGPTSKHYTKPSWGLLIQSLGRCSECDVQWALSLFFNVFVCLKGKLDPLLISGFICQQVILPFTSSRWLVLHSLTQTVFSLIVVSFAFLAFAVLVFWFSLSEVWLCPQAALMYIIER